MKQSSFSLSLLVVSQLSPLMGQTALFDINSDDLGNGFSGALLEGWAPLDIPNAATSGPFSGTFNGITLTLNSTGQFRGRDRGTADTVQGGDNNDNQVPIGAFGDMYREFAFLLPGDNLEASLSGLVPDANYFVTVFSWDSGQAPLTESDWGVSGGQLSRVVFQGDLVNNLDTSVDPNTDALSDYAATFTITADSSGEATFQGELVSGGILAFNGVTLDIDADADGLPDSFEQGIIDADENDLIATIEDVLPGADFDSDNLTNEAEFGLKTDPADDDSDDDNLLDGVENQTGTWEGVMMTGTNPLVADSDGDGLLDGVENPDLDYDPANAATQPGTDPNIFDTDEDSVSDGTEVLSDRTDPTDPSSFFDPLAGALVAFDFGPTDVQPGWVGAPAGSGSDGTISVLVEAVGGAIFQERDRGAAATDSGDDTNNAMWKDFIFAQNSTAGSVEVGLTATISGLAPSTIYPITVFAHDPLTAEGAGASMLWEDNSIVITGEDPQSLGDPTTLTRFEASSDPSGVIVLSGFVGTEEPVGATNNVFINGLIVGAAAGSDVPEITSVKRDSGNGNITLTWASKASSTYRVVFIDDQISAGVSPLAVPIENWADLDDQVTGQAGETSYTDFSAGSASRRFYAVIENP